MWWKLLLHSIKILFFIYSVISLLLKSCHRIRKDAQVFLENERYRANETQLLRSIRLQTYYPLIAEEDTQVNAVSDTPGQGICRRKLNPIGTVQVVSKHNNLINRNADLSNGVSDDEFEHHENKRHYSVQRIAKKFEAKEQKQKMHVSQPSNRTTESYFEGRKPRTKPSDNTLTKPMSNNNSNTEFGTFTHQVNTCNAKDKHMESNGTLLNSLSDTQKVHDIEFRADTPNTVEVVTDLKHFLREKRAVQSVEQILSEQRFSRSLSSYSISDLIKDLPPETNIDQIIDDINK